MRSRALLPFARFETFATALLTAACAGPGGGAGTILPPPADSAGDVDSGEPGFETQDGAPQPDVPPPVVVPDCRDQCLEEPAAFSEVVEEAAALCWPAGVEGCPDPGEPCGCDLLAESNVLCQGGEIALAPVHFESVLVAGTWSAVKAGPEWSRHCGPGGSAGIILDLAFRSQERPDGDRDRDLRPGDVVEGCRVMEGGSASKDVNLTGAGRLNLAVGCIEPWDDGDPACSGTSGGGTLQVVEYHARAGGRRAGHDVVLLVDDGVEGDPTGVRISKAKWVLSDLNAEDRAWVLRFGSGTPLDDAPCDATGDPDPCLEAIQGGLPARSNLWDAVALAWDHLASLPAGEGRSKHVIALAEGPDTCAATEAATPCEPSCGESRAEDLLARAAGGAGIFVHFIQWESAARPGPDPRQMRVACETGGDFRFVRSHAFLGDVGAFGEALGEALGAIRTALPGVWHLGIQVPPYALNVPPPSGSPPGAVYALDGDLVVKGASRLTPSGTDMAFSLGDGEAFPDVRPVLRKACAKAADCGAAAEPASECHTVCSAETLVCTGGAFGVPAPDGSPCDEEGLCCQGTCQPAGSACPACD